YPSLNRMELIDFKVRILSPEAGTGAITRVMIESGDDEGRVWQTMGVSPNIIDASYNALFDAIVYKLFVDGHKAS
ncbi:MAG: citramalate synthase, partial [Geminicoccaceae bacterium]|nr:citramalate synthase [Geminicoccaceae bacterium]